MWDGIAKFLVGIFDKLLTVFIARQSGKDAARADSAERTIEVVRDVNRPAGDDELGRVRDKYRRET